MKETEVFSSGDVPIFEDSNGNVYTHADPDFESILKAIDTELHLRGLELLNGDCGSGDYFFCIVDKR